MSSNKFFALMKLAGSRCQNDVLTLISYFIGAIIFVGFFGIFWMRNVADYQPWITTTEIPNIAGTQLSVVLIAAIVAFVNAWSFLLWLAITLLLADYAFNFLIVCWLYDDKSWEIPKWINAKFDEWEENRRNQWNNNYKNYLDDQNELSEAIDKIRDS